MDCLGGVAGKLIYVHCCSLYFLLTVIRVNPGDKNLVALISYNFRNVRVTLKTV